MIDWKFIGKQATAITIIVLCGFASLGLAALIIKAAGVLYQ